MADAIVGGGSVAAVIGIAVVVVLYLAAIIAPLVMLVVALVDMVRRPDWQWRIARQERVLWILLVVLVNLFAIPSLIYWFNIRRKLQAVEAAAAAGLYGSGHYGYGGWEPGPPPMPYTAVAAPGWHPDPSGRSQFRWWDGLRWTDQTWGQGSGRR
jgi:hypothetical protein